MNVHFLCIPRQSQGCTPSEQINYAFFSEFCETVWVKILELVRELLIFSESEGRKKNRCFSKKTRFRSRDFHKKKNHIIRVDSIDLLKFAIDTDSMEDARIE